MGLVWFIAGAGKCNYVCVVVTAPLQRHPTVPIFAAGSGFESRKSRRNGPWLLSSCGHSRRTPNYTTLPVQFPRLSLSVSLVLCDTAAGGVEAAVLARLHHVALPLWAVSSRLRSCAAAVEAAVVADSVAAGGAAVTAADEVLRAAAAGAANFIKRERLLLLA